MHDDELYENIKLRTEIINQTSEEGPRAIASGLVAVAYGLVMAGKYIARAIAKKQVNQTGEYE